MFSLQKKNWFGSKHAILSEQFLFVTETSQTAASPKQKNILAGLFLYYHPLSVLFRAVLTRHAAPLMYSITQS